MHVMINKVFEYRDAATGRKRTVPRGWAGELPETVVQDAVSGGYGVSDELAAKTKSASDIQSARDAVKAAEAAVKGARAEPDKAKAEADLRTAREALAKLEG